KPHGCGILRTLLEQDCRRLRPGMIHDLGQRAHFQLPIGPRDAHDLARALGPRDELAQIAVGPIVGVEALSLRALGFFQHGVSFGKSLPVFCHAHEDLSCLLTGIAPSTAMIRRVSWRKTNAGRIAMLRMRAVIALWAALAVAAPMAHAADPFYAG